MFRSFKIPDMKNRVLITLAILGSATFAFGQDVNPLPSTDSTSIEAQREAELAKWKGAMPKPNEVAAAAEKCFEKAIADQTIEELKELADASNRAANFIGFITTQYQNYYRENYRYDFIQKQVLKSASAWEEKKNQFLMIRNQAYFNLGMKFRDAGQDMVAFMYFRDAHRLSPFTTGKDGEAGMRHAAEIEMKKILGLEDMPSFITWK